jgi:hypothetical protein
LGILAVPVLYVLGMVVGETTLREGCKSSKREEGEKEESVLEDDQVQKHHSEEWCA